MNEAKRKNKFELILDDAPYQKPVCTGLFRYESKIGELEIEINTEEGWVTVDGEDRASTDTISTYDLVVDEDDEKVLSYYSKNDELISLNLPYSVVKSIEEKEKAFVEWKEKSREWLRQTDLVLVVDDHEYQSKGNRTPYDCSKRVLKPNKAIMYMTDEEREVYDRLKNEYGVADGFPIAPDNYDEGTQIKYDNL